MSTTVFSRLMAELATVLHTEPFVLSEDRECALAIDDTVICVEHLPESEQVLLYAEVMELPEKGREDLYRSLLEGQLFFVRTGGAALAVSEKLNKVFLQVLCPLASLDVATFSAALENMVNLVAYWQQECKLCSKIAIVSERSKPASFIQA